MADTEDDNFDEAFKGFGEDPAPVTPPTAPATPPVAPPVEPSKEEPKPPTEPKKEESKDEPTQPGKEVTPPEPDDKEKEEVAKQPEAPAAAPEAPKPTDDPDAKPSEPAQPLTKDDVQAVVSDLLNTERSTSKELDSTTKEVLDAYYPDGLSNTLVDEKSGKELKTPQDVVDASGGEMSTEEAAQWLMNEQYRMDNDVAKIKNDARAIAETTVNFKRDAISAVQKYEPLFKAYPTLQEKTFNKLMKLVKVDEKKNVILSAPDVIEFYDDALEPYQQAFEFANNKPATNPAAPAADEAPKPTAEDRMDVAGDGGQSAPNDPNDFAQQVTKELS